MKRILLLAGLLMIAATVLPQKDFNWKKYQRDHDNYINTIKYRLGGNSPSVDTLIRFLHGIEKIGFSWYDNSYLSDKYYDPKDIYYEHFSVDPNDCTFCIMTIKKGFWEIYDVAGGSVWLVGNGFINDLDFDEVKTYLDDCRNNMYPCEK
jgi:hypothetical protein